MPRFVVTSCGGLVEGLSEEDFFKCRSMPRNRELMRVFRDIELVEQIGSGMSRILKAYDRSIFELSPGFTVVAFPYEEGFISPAGKINGKISGKINGKINGKIKSTLDLLKSTPTMTIPELAEYAGKSQRSISRELREYQPGYFIGFRSEGAQAGVDTRRAQ